MTAQPKQEQDFFEKWVSRAVGGLVVSLVLIVLIAVYLQIAMPWLSQPAAFQIAALIYGGLVVLALKLVFGRRR